MHIPLADETKSRSFLMYGCFEDRTARSLCGVSLMAHERLGRWIDSPSKTDSSAITSSSRPVDPVVLIVHVLVTEEEDHDSNFDRDPSFVDEPLSFHPSGTAPAPSAVAGRRRSRKIKVFASECQRLTNGRLHYSALSLRKRLAESARDEETADTRPYDVVSSKNESVTALPHTTENILELFGSRLQLKSSSRRFKDTSKPLIKGRHFEFDGSLTVGEKTLSFVEQTNRQNQGTSYNVWDGALLLARYLQYEADSVKGLRVLELGAGCGVVGLSVAALGASYVTMTDLPGDVLEHLQRNIDANEELQVGCRVESRACDWTDPPLDLVAMRKYDIILVADCIWVEELVAPLFDVLEHLTRYADETSVPFVEESTESTSVLPQNTKDEAFVSIQEIGKNTRDERSSGTLDDSTHDKFERGSLERQDAVGQSLFYHDDFEDCSSFYEEDTAKTTRVIISYQRRGKSTHETFLGHLHALFSNVEIVQAPNQPEVFTIFSCQR